MIVPAVVLGMVLSQPAVQQPAAPPGHWRMPRAPNFDVPVVPPEARERIAELAEGGQPRCQTPVIVGDARIDPRFAKPHEERGTDYRIRSVRPKGC